MLRHGPFLFVTICHTLAYYYYKHITMYYRLNKDNRKLLTNRKRYKRVKEAFSDIKRKGNIKRRKVSPQEVSAQKKRIREHIEHDKYINNVKIAFALFIAAIAVWTLFEYVLYIR